jgi:hypothetical protein
MCPTFTEAWHPQADFRLSHHVAGLSAAFREPQHLHCPELSLSSDFRRLTSVLDRYLSFLLETKAKRTRIGATCNRLTHFQARSGERPAR